VNTSFANIVTAIIAALQAQPPVCDLIDRARATVVPDQVSKAVSVQWEKTVPAAFTISNQPMDWQTQITIECLARSIKDPGDLAVDPLLRDVVARLALDPTLNDTLADLRIAGIEAENTNEGKKTGWVRLTYIAEHRTYNGILE
jgi:hypothetical protein